MTWPLFLGLLSLIAQPGLSGLNEWTGGGPEGGSVQALLVDSTNPSQVYAYASARIFRSTDHASTWSASDQVLSSGIKRFTMGSAGVLYGVWGPYSCCFAIYWKSTDSGASWVAVEPEIGGADVEALAVDPTTPSTLYLGTREGFFISTDTGETWNASNTGLGDPPPEVSVVAVIPTTPTTLFISIGSSPYGYFKSTDGGATWQQSGAGLNIRAVWIVVDPQTTTTLYATATSSTVYKSTDAGENWVARDTGLPEFGSRPALAIDPTAPTTLYWGDAGEIYRTMDGAETWSTLDADLGGFDVNGLAVDPVNSNNLYAATGSGVFKSTDGGDTWDEANSGLEAAYTSEIVSDPSVPSTVYAAHAGVVKSGDAGRTWEQKNQGLAGVNPTSIAVAASDSQVVYSAGYSEVFRSTDGGSSWDPTIANWEDFGPWGPQAMALAVDPESSDRVYAGNYSDYYEGFETPPAVLRSTDAGVHWEALHIPAGEFRFLEPDTIVLDPTDPDRIFVMNWFSPLGGGFDTTVLRTLDGGTTWQEVWRGEDGFPAGLALDAGDPTTVYLGFTGRSSLGVPGDVFKSTDGGDTWLPLDTELPCVVSVAADPRRANTIYAGGCEHVYVSSDGGTNWAPLGAASLPGDPSYGIWALEVASSLLTTLHAGTFRGIYSYTIDQDICVTNLELRRETLPYTKTFEATTSIAAGDRLRLVSPAVIVFRAGDHIVLEDGFAVEAGARFTAEIDPSLVCPTVGMRPPRIKPLPERIGGEAD